MLNEALTIEAEDEAIKLLRRKLPISESKFNKLSVHSFQTIRVILQQQQTICEKKYIDLMKHQEKKGKK